MNDGYTMQNQEETDLPLKLDRQALLDKFNQLLDTAFETEAPLNGLDQDFLQSLENDAGESAGHDLYSLWCAMTSLSQEVRIQGRLFKQLNDSLSGLGDLEQTIRDTAQQSEAMQRKEKQEFREAGRRDAIESLLDVRERLLRLKKTGDEQASSATGPSRMPWFMRLFPSVKNRIQEEAAALEALRQAHTLALGKLDETLTLWGVEEIDYQRGFDPAQMNAMDVRPAQNSTDGTILDIYQRGYIWKNQVIRTAQVCVARNIEDVSQARREKR